MSQRAVAGAAGTGVVLGSAGRNLPTVLVGFVYRGGQARSCGVEAAADCAVANLTSGLGHVLVFGLVVVAVTVGFAVAGASSATFGLVRLRRVPTGDGRRTGSSPAADPVGLGLVAVGAALVTPALWLALSFLVFWAG